MKKILSAVFDCLWPITVYLAVQIVILSLMQTTFKSSPQGGLLLTPENLKVLEMGVMALAGLVLFIPYALRKKLIDTEKERKRLADPVISLSSLFSGIGFFMLFASVMFFIKDTSVYRSYLALVDDFSKASLPLRVSALFILSPLLEETVFRAVTFSNMRKHMSLPAALFFQAFLFAFCHFNPVQFTYALIAGIVLGVVYLKSESLAISFLFHMAFNASNLIVENVGFLSSSGLALLLLGLVLIIPSYTLFIKSTKRARAA